MVRSSLQRLSKGFAVVGLAVGGLMTALLGGPSSGPVAVVFPPWWDASRSIDAAAKGGAVLRLGITHSIVIVAPTDPQSTARLWRAGAWLMLNPSGLAGCGFKPDT